MVSHSYFLIVHQLLMRKVVNELLKICETRVSQSPLYRKLILENIFRVVLKRQQPEPPGPGVAGQQFPRPVLPPGVGAHACHPWLR